MGIYHGPSYCEPSTLPLDQIANALIHISAYINSGILPCTFELTKFGRLSVLPNGLWVWRQSVALVAAVCKTRRRIALSLLLLLRTISASYFYSFGSVQIKKVDSALPGVDAINILCSSITPRQTFTRSVKTDLSSDPDLAGKKDLRSSKRSTFSSGSRHT